MFPLKLKETLVTEIGETRKFENDKTKGKI